MHITKTPVNGITWPTTGTLFNVDCLQLITLLQLGTVRIPYYRKLTIHFINADFKNSR